MKPKGPVALDGSLRGSPSGIGLYSDRLVQGLAAGPFGPRLLPLSPPPGRSRTLWLVGEVAQALEASGAVLFHGVANFDLPLSKPRGMQYVLTVHDLIPLQWPEAVSPLYRLQFGAWLSRCLALADAVLCDTAAVADQVRARSGRVPLHVVPLGADHLEAGGASPARRPYVLCVGSVERRKNVGLVVEAFAAVHRRLPEVELVVAGHLGHGGRSIVRRLEALAAQGTPVRWVGGQDRSSLDGLLRGARAVLCPSLAEGFGLPGIEAMQLGVPVLASDIAVHREVLGDGAWLLPATGPEAAGAWGSAIERLLREAQAGPELPRAGRARARRFTWSQTARETEAVYGALLSPRALG